MRLFVTVVDNPSTGVWIPRGLTAVDEWVLWPLDVPGPRVLVLADVDTNPTSGILIGDPEVANFHTGRILRRRRQRLAELIDRVGADLDEWTPAEITRALLPNDGRDIRGAVGDRVVELCRRGTGERRGRVRRQRQISTQPPAFPRRSGRTTPGKAG